MDVVALEPLDLDSSAAFLLGRTGQDDAAAARALGEALGGIPLALELAAALIANSDLSLAQYASIVAGPGSQEGVLVPSEESLTAPRLALLRSFHLIERADPAAGDLLRLSAYLAPDRIPLELLRSFAHDLPEPLLTVLRDGTRTRDMLGLLQRHALIESADALISLHSLVQAAVRESMTHDQARLWSSVAVGLLNASFPSDPNDVSSRALCEQLFRHGLSAAEHAERLGVSLGITARLFTHLGIYHRVRGQYGDAVSLSERALALVERTRGGRSSDLAAVLSNLGSSLNALGKHEESLRYHERALSMVLDIFGPDASQIGIFLFNAGQALSELGNHGEALKHLLRAYDMDVRDYGEESLRAAADLNAIGGTYLDMGDLAKARIALEQALSIDERILGKSHPTVGNRHNNLGALLAKAGDLLSARSHLERALEIEVTTVGPDHPDVGVRRNNLGMVLKGLGETAAAREQYERALVTLANALGEDHRYTIGVRSNLASLGETER